MCENSSSSIRTDLGTTRNICIRPGVKQGDLPSAVLFCLIIRAILLEAFYQLNYGIKLVDENITDKCYANDVGLMAESVEQMSRLYIIEVFTIVKLPKMLSAGGTLEVFENKILGPDVKLFWFLFCYVANVRTQRKQSLVKTEERKKQLCLPYVVLFPGSNTQKKSGNVSLFRIPGYQGETMRQLSQERRRLWLNAIRRSDDSWRKTECWRVCNKHFIQGSPSLLLERDNPDWVPSLCLGYARSGMYCWKV